LHVYAKGTTYLSSPVEVEEDDEQGSKHAQCNEDSHHEGANQLVLAREEGSCNHKHIFLD